jgi:hypothetical protein
MAMVEIIEDVVGATPEEFREKLIEQIQVDLAKVAEANGLGRIVEYDCELLRENFFEIAMMDVDGLTTSCTIELRPFRVN